MAMFILVIFQFVILINICFICGMSSISVPVLPTPLIIETGESIVIWSLACACITLVALGVATCKYFR